MQEVFMGNKFDFFLQICSSTIKSKKKNLKLSMKSKTKMADICVNYNNMV